MPRRPLIPTPELRRVVGDLLELQNRVGRMERGGRATQLGHSSIDGGYLTIRDADGLPRGYIGNQPDGTTGVRAVNGPPPSRPNTPDGIPIQGGVRWEWNGEFVEPRPGDFLNAHLYVSGAGADFISGPSNLVHAFSEPGSFPTTGLGTAPVWARIVAYNTSGEPSEPSFTVGPITPLEVVADDIVDGIVTTVKIAAGAVTEAVIAASAVTVTKIADDAITSPQIIAGGIQAVNLAVDSVSAGKIAADAVTAREILALTITAAEIAANAITATHITAGSVTASKLESVLVLTNRVVVGAAAGDRVEINATSGIEQWLSGARTLHIPPNGSASFTGKVTSGAGVGVGSTIVIDPVLIEQSFYPNNTTKRFRFQAGMGAVVGGGSGPILDIEAVNASGLERGAFIHMESVTDTTGVLWIGFTGASSLQGGRLQMEQGGRVVLAVNSTNILDMGAGSTDITTANQPINIRSNGAQINIDTAGNQLLIGSSASNYLVIDNGNVALVENGGLKAFIIDHPVDAARRLVHVCTETPNAMVEYVGTATLKDGVAVVGAPDLPGYFEALTELAGRTVTVTRILLDNPIPLTAPLPVVAASLPVDGTFRIECGAPDGTQISWRVTANRKNTKFDVEPLAATTPLPDGPYGIATPKESSNG